MPTGLIRVLVVVNCVLLLLTISITAADEAGRWELPVVSG